MFGIGIPELILILIVGLVVFGPSKLPEVGRAVGKGLREFKKASHALQGALNASDDEPPRPKYATPATELPAKAPEAAPPPYIPPTQDSVREKLAAAQSASSETEKEKNTSKETIDTKN